MCLKRLQKQLATFLIAGDFELFIAELCLESLTQTEKSLLFCLKYIHSNLLTSRFS